MLSFQKLDVYQCAILFTRQALQISADIPRGHSALGDQLRRACFSISLNIAEASGRRSATDAARHYAISRGSAMECAAILDVVRLIEAVTDEQYEQANELLSRVVAMLTRLCR